MQLFSCGNCEHPVFFENTVCIHCGSFLGFDAASMEMKSFSSYGNLSYTDIKYPDRSYKYCANHSHNVCNWVLDHSSFDFFCVACSLNRTIPDLAEVHHYNKWLHIEIAKHRLVYSLLKWKLPVISKFKSGDTGIAFDFKANENDQRLLTGHDNGLITLNIEEADDALREMERNRMDEVYRTVLGHFRHEIGHYYWDRLIAASTRLEKFRELFGDERGNYNEALNSHYAKIGDETWRNEFISSYSRAHPWEDWAETWAHYMHMVDTLETGYAFGISLHPIVAKRTDEMDTTINIDPYASTSFDAIIERWIPLTFAMNSLNRSMGLKDSYPFIINNAVRNKLRFIHETIHAVD